MTKNKQKLPHNYTSWTMEEVQNENRFKNKVLFKLLNEECYFLRKVKITNFTRILEYTFDF